MSKSINERDLTLVEQLGFGTIGIRNLLAPDRRQSALSEYEKHLLKQGGARLLENEERK